MNRMKTNMLWAGFLTAAMMCAGCSVLNPYKSKLACPNMDPGKCQSTRQTYYESLEEAEDPMNYTPDLEASSCTDCVRDKKKRKKNSELPELKPASYDEMVLEKISSQIEQPDIPMVVPAQAIRILVLPYKGRSGNLFTERYVYSFVEEPRWVLEDFR